MAAIAAAGVWTFAPGSDPTPLPAKPPPAQHAAAGAGVPAVARAPLRPDVQQMAPASIEDQVRTWSASVRPIDWLRAFQSIEQCLQLERDKELVDAEVEVVKQGPDAGPRFVFKKVDERTTAALRQSCASMTGRTRLDRFQLLERAVDAHVAGALTLYIAQGPQGDHDALRDRPGDPLVAAWRERALQRVDEGLRLGYHDTLMTAPTDYAMLGRTPTAEDDYARALAVNQVVGAINHGDQPYPQTLLDGLSRQLDPRQRREAELRAERIFEAWKSRQP